MRVTAKRFWVAVLAVLLLLCTSAAAFAAPVLGSRLLRYGMTGEDVQELQTLLTSQSYWVGRADGIFGTRTHNGVLSFQKDHDLKMDGIVGPQTLGKLKNNISNLYVVKTGDTLYAISQVYKTTITRLKELNNLTSDLIYIGQRLKVPAAESAPEGGVNPPSSGQTEVLPLADIIRSKGISNPTESFRITVDKSDHILKVYSGSTYLKSYKVSIGEGGLTDKEKAGDHKTPVGSFYVTEMSVFAQPDPDFGTRWMELSYPDIKHAEKGLATGLIDQAAYNSIVIANDNRQMPAQNTALGGGIGIHGGSDTNGTGDWTWGCVGLFNSDVEEIYAFVTIGTPVDIQE